MKILIVDDEPLVRRSLQKVFERAGHSTILAEDGIVGVEKWKECSPDAVILDVLMPGHTGPEVISEVKPDSKVPIVLISAYSGEYNPDSVKQLGADVFIAKPFENIQEIVTTVESLVESRKS
jgi:two-component system chemotaxis response regulator CheY/two-component system KDP operon response regulator KdpE